jgi:protein TilB
MLTVNLIRKRSEHWDGDLRDLEEITLHQQDLENIDLLVKKCPKLKILYLQGNQLTQLPELRMYYLDTLLLQMNNLQDVFGLQECPQLRVLDLTLNFISNLECLNGLVYNRTLQSLSLEGNPVTKIENYKKFLISRLPLKQLDHIQVEKTEVLEARLHYPNLDSEVKHYLKTYKRIDSKINIENCQPNKDITAEEFAKQKTGHTIEDRLRTARELKVIRAKEEATEVKIPKERVYVDSNGNILQCNELNLEYDYLTTNSVVQFKIYVPKSINTDAIVSVIKEDYISVEYNQKKLILKSFYPMIKNSGKASRSLATGVLKLTAYKNGHENTEDPTVLFERESKPLPKQEMEFKSSDKLEIPHDLPELIE